MGPFLLNESLDIFHITNDILYINFFESLKNNSSWFRWIIDSKMNIEDTPGRA
jgi:hypothetical protein